MTGGIRRAGPISCTLIPVLTGRTREKKPANRLSLNRSPHLPPAPVALNIIFRLWCEGIATAAACGPRFACGRFTQGLQGGCRPLDRWNFAQGGCWVSASDYQLKSFLMVCMLFGAGLAVTELFRLGSVDLAVSGLFYEPGGPNNGWLYAKLSPWVYLYDYGAIPALVMGGGSFGLYLCAVRGWIAKTYRKPMLLMALTVLLGPGLLVNGILKPGWGRPRPVDVIHFNGSQPYRDVTDPGGPGTGKSFTCGHCSMGFALAAGVGLLPLHPGVATFSLVVGIGYGLLMSMARIVQGGHFLSDALWSGVVVFSLIVVLYSFVLRIPEALDDG